MKPPVDFLKSRCCARRSGEVEAGHVHRLVRRGEFGEAVVDDQGGAAPRVEHRGVEAESGADDHPVVAQLLHDLVGPGEAEADAVHAVVGVLLDGQHVSVQQGVLRLELIGVEEVVVDRADVTDVVGVPGHADGVRAGDMDDRCGLDKVVSGLQSGVALADDQDPPIGEVLGVHGDDGVVLGGLDTRKVGDIGPGQSGGHDQSTGSVFVTVLIGDREAVLVTADPLHPGVVGDVQLERLREVGEIAHQIVGVREVALAVAAEEQVGIRGQQGVPVHPEIQLGIVGAVVHLVDRDQLAVPGEGAEERAGSLAALQNPVSVPGLLQ